MRPILRLAVPLCLAALLVPFAAEVRAAAPPEVYSVIEGRDADRDRPVLVFIGKKMNKFIGFHVGAPGGAVEFPPPEVLLAGKDTLVLALAPEIPPGGVDVTLLHKGGEMTFRVGLENGSLVPGVVGPAALAGELRSELDDAETLDGRAPSWYTDASHLDAGTLDPARFSAWDDLLTESRVGPGTAQAARGDHLHDTRYFTKTELSSAGVVNDGGNPVEWTRLKNVPEGLADGTDMDTTYAAGEGLSLAETVFSVVFGGNGAAPTAARADHLHDARYSLLTHLHDDRYFTESELSAAGGTVNGSTNPVDWTRLKSVPAGIADGVDADTTYDAGAGLALSGTTFSTVFGGTGAATTSARSDHLHDTVYAALAHLHDDRYFTESELSAAGGTVNGSTNPVDWTRLKSVPAGIADGVDADTTYDAGAGLSLTGTTFSTLFGGTGAAATAARSDHDHGSSYASASHLHDDRYFTEAELSAAGGTVNATGNPVDWSRLKGIPATLADGVDDDAWTTSGADVHRASGRVGIGTTAPAMALHVAGNDGAVFGGTFGSGATPPTGAGSRMLWYPAKAAFRAGRVGSSQWDAAAIGNYSFAVGRDVTAREDHSVALGQSTLSNASHSLAGGYLSQTEGIYSFAYGYNCRTSGAQGTALGFGTVAGGAAASALGWLTEATGKGSLAAGYTTLAEGDYSVAMGASCEAAGSATVAAGFSSRADAYASVALGRYNVLGGSKTAWVATDAVLVVGNGVADDERADAFRLLKNGNLTISGTLTQNSDERLKTDIRPLGDVLERVERMRGVSYLMRDPARGPAGRQVGLLAQDVRDAFPELVEADGRGVLSVAYGNLSAVLVEAVKEQQRRLRERDAEIAALREELRTTRAATDARLRRIEALLGADAGAPDQAGDRSSDEVVSDEVVNSPGGSQSRSTEIPSASAPPTPSGTR